ncbi:tetratricopeptide repeat protein [Thermodesulfobium sp. 4217-1]|uniref:tetratricopeptide repeat protein n=1 Tax=Thermodesulfobium sp. 4217-1 TaxID=3120013 RepID=UPI003221624D
MILDVKFDRGVELTVKKFFIISVFVLFLIFLFPLLFFNGSDRGYLNSANSFFDKKEYFKAISFYNMAIESNPKLVDAYVIGQTHISNCTNTTKQFKIFQRQ